MSYRVIPGWLAGEARLLPAVQALYAYDDKWPNRATGWAYGMPPSPGWPFTLRDLGPVLLASLERDTGTVFTAVAYQAYRDGTGCGWHHDRDWGAQAILSLGVPRTFGLRKAGHEEFVRQAHGDLLYMPPGFQDEWEHGVPEEDAPGERVSLVFRGPRS